MRCTAAGPDTHVIFHQVRTQSSQHYRVVRCLLSPLSVVIVLLILISGQTLPFFQLLVSRLTAAGAM